jgi:hypothetical protein
MRRICLALLSIIIALGFGATMQRGMANQDDSNIARDNLLQAENSVTQAFTEVQKANRAGADVYTLKENLTIVQAYLENSQIAYDSGEFSVSVEYSHQAMSLANETILEAVKLRNQAIEQVNTVRYATIASFIVSDFVACIAGLYLINRIYKYQHDKFLKKRPERGGCASD